MDDLRLLDYLKARSEYGREGKKRVLELRGRD